MEVKFKEIHNLLPPLPDKEFFLNISEGLQKILFNANSLLEDSDLLGQHRRINSQNILFNLAEEEAGKFLLLLDAVRCPRGNLSKHLKQFNSHIAKGIYAVSSYWQFSDFAEVILEINRYYKQNALIFIEPEGAWIARNPITTQRELQYYADYVVAYTGKPRWINPSEDNRTSPPLEIPEALELANALYNSGFSKPGSLEKIAEIWRPVQMSDNYSADDLYKQNLKTLKQLSDDELLEDQPEEIYHLISISWSFPMHSIELGKIGTKPSQLKDQVNLINNDLKNT